MRVVPWVLAGALLVVARAIASSIPAEQIPPEAITPQSVETARESGLPFQPQPTEAPLSAEDSPDGAKGQAAPPKPARSADCQSAGSAVVTIHAGRAFGSGSIVSPNGLVITNNHVVRPARGRDIRVRTANGVRYSGRVVAVDPMNDLALVRLDTQERLPSVRFGSPQAIQMGQPVCAIGSPFGRPGVLTRGTLTTVRRNGDLQSALVLQPGNSGGPLLNQQGEVIGINKAIWQSRDGINSGISFATNIDVAKSFIEQNGGAVQAARSTGFDSSSVMVPGSRREVPRPSVAPGSYKVPSINQGAYTVPTTPLSPGVNAPLEAVSGPRLGVMLDKETLVIQQVEAISAASVAGLRTGDRLVAIDGNQLQNYNQLQDYLSGRPSSAVLTINRSNQLQTVQINF